MAGRLFTFGCSFTSYHWPTWADLLLTQVPGENWGSAGGGNKFIFESLVECHVKNKIGKDDTVVIMWSSFTREDRYINHHWNTRGNVYNAEPLYDSSFLKKYWDDRGCVLNNLNFIVGATMFLEHIDCKWAMASMIPIIALENSYTPIIDDTSDFVGHLAFIDNYREKWVSDDLESHCKTSFRPKIWWGNQGLPRKEKWSDNHPSTLVHYDWVVDKLLCRIPHLKINVPQLNKVSVEFQTMLHGVSSRIDGHPSHCDVVFNKKYQSRI